MSFLRIPFPLRPWEDALSFLQGATGALMLSAFFALMRLSGKSHVAMETGLGSHLLGTQGDKAFFAGLALHLLFGGALGFTLKRGLHFCRWSGPLTGITAGFSYWFVISLLVGAFPTIDWLTPMGQPRVGPFGVLDGPFTFYCLLLAHLFFGAWVGSSPTSRRKINQRGR